MHDQSDNASKINRNTPKRWQ